MVYTLSFFSSKCSLFHNPKVFGSCIIHTLYTGVPKFKKNNSCAKRLIDLSQRDLFDLNETKFPRLRPFVLLVGKACGWKSVWDIGGIIVPG
jgi:hypothetical protein